MKCLFFLYGEYRTFEIASEFWNILNIPNLDIVIHTPTTTSTYHLDNTHYEINESNFSKIDNKKIFFHGRDDYQITDTHSTHFSYRFLSKYLNELCDIKYDFIFIGRLDSTFYVENYTDLLLDKTNTLYAINPPYITPDHAWMADHAFFGSYDTIKEFVDKLPPTELMEDSHHCMGVYVKQNFECSYWKYKFRSEHIKPNMVSYFEEYLKTYGKLKEIDKSYIDFIDQFKQGTYQKLEIEYKAIYK